MGDANRTLGVLRELTRALEGGGALAGGGALDKALMLVTDAALKIFPGDHASVRILDPSRTELVSGARSGVGVGKKPVRHAPGQGVAGWVVAQGKLARIADTRLDQRFASKPNQGFEIRSILAVPLWSNGSVMGVLAVTSQLADAFTEEDEQLGVLMANAVMAPIERLRLAQLAATDPETMAYASSFLRPALERYIDRLRGTTAPLSVIVLELDGFVCLGDARGAEVEDAVLKEAARRLRACTRDRDDVVRRTKAEFALIMPGTGLDSATTAAERIRAQMETQPIAVPVGDRVTQTVSIGVAAWDGRELGEELERRAQDAMLAAKTHGKNRVHALDHRSITQRPTSPPAGEPGVE